MKRKIDRLTEHVILKLLFLGDPAVKAMKYFTYRKSLMIFENVIRTWLRTSMKLLLEGKRH
jgi:hypothetical protein